MCECNLTGSSGWDMITTIIAILALFVSVLSAWQAYRTTSIQALLQLDNIWHSDYMRASRKRAAISLTKDDPDADADRVLDYFETIAGIFVNQPKIFSWLPFKLWPVIPDKWARHTFYWICACYWMASEDYIKTVRGSSIIQKTTWEDFSNLINKWITIEGKPAAEEVKEFLSDEQSIKI